MRRTIAVALLLLLPAAAGARPGSHPSTAPEAVQSSVRAAVAGLEAAVKSRDLDRIQACYAPDSLLHRDVRSRFVAAVGLDSLRCHERVAAVYARGDTAEAVVCEGFTWVEHSRGQCDETWRTLDLLARDGAWRIVSDREREYAHARSTDLTVELHPEQGTVSGQALLSVEFAAAGEDSVLLRLNRGLEIRSLEDPSGHPVPFTRAADLVTVYLPPNSGRASDSATAPGPLQVRLTFEGTFFNESKEVGYSQVGIAPGGSFASWVTSWYPHLAGTYSKSPGQITYIVPAGITIASSGSPIESRAEGSGSRQVFRVKEPLDFSFAAARYFHRSRTVDGVSLGVYFLRGGDAKAELYLKTCARILSFLRGAYGFYPFDGYAVVEVPAEAVGTLGGSSEQGMNLFPVGALPDSTFPLALLSHEIGHSWWGNLVQSGNVAMLDEGLAQMTAVLSVQALAGEKMMRRFLTRGFPMYEQSARLYFHSFAGQRGRDLPLTTASSGSDLGAILHDLADTKGFFVYEMLREEIGDAAFLGGLRRAAREYARRAIRLEDLRRLWEQASGRDLGWFFEQWLAREGAPELRLRYTISPLAGGRSEVRGEVTQTGEPYRARAEVVLARAGAAPRTERIDVAGPETSFRLVADARPDTLLLDPACRILRWTDEYRHQDLYEAALGLYSTGATDSADLELTRYLDQAPMALNGHCQRGRWALAAGDPAGAEREFRWVLDRASLYDPDDPAVTWSEVGLGQIADLGKRRDDAVAWYRKALARDDGSQALEAAAAGLASPYSPLPPPAATDPALLRRCEGTYGMSAGPSIQVSVGRSGLLIASIPGRPPTGLRLVEGARFREIGDTPLTYEFSGEGARFSDLTIETGGRAFHLQRKD